MSITGNGLMYGSLDNRGLIWTSYSGYFNADVNFFSTATTLTGTNGAYRGTTSDLTSTSTATNGNIVAGIRDGFSIQFLGYFFAPQSGTYTWSIASDDRSYLWIGPNAKTGYTTSNAIFFDNWDIQNNPVSVLLTGGIYYPIRIQYGDNAGPDSFSMYFTLPGSSTPIYNGNDYYFNDGTLLDGVLLNASVVVTPLFKFDAISVAAAFTPTTVSGIQLWLDANDNTTLQLSSTTVNQWNDKSGKGYNATQYGLTTAVTYSANGFNKLPAISFTSGQGLIANSPSGTFPNGITIFAVFSTTGTASYIPLVNKTTNNLPAPLDMYNTYIYYGNGSSFASTTGYNLNTLNTLNLFSVSYNYQSPNLTIQEFNNGTSALNTVINNAVYGDTANNIYIGLRADRVTTFVGVMSEIIVYNTNLTTTQRQNIEGYLAQKWGLLSSLPSNHPYYPITITNNNFTTPGGATNTTILANAGSTTAYGWTFNSSTAGSYFHIYYCSLWSAYYTFPSQYTYNVDFQFYLNTGTMYMTQSITFPANGTYILTLWATPFGQNLYNTNQKLSAYIDSTQVITNWTGVTSSGVVIAQLLTSIPFTVTAGTHTLKLQSDCLTNTINSTIDVTGININLYVS